MSDIDIEVEQLSAEIKNVKFDTPTKFSEKFAALSNAIIANKNNLDAITKVLMAEETSLHNLFYSLSGVNKYQIYFKYQNEIYKLILLLDKLNFKNKDNKDNKDNKNFYEINVFTELINQNFTPEIKNVFIRSLELLIKIQYPTNLGYSHAIECHKYFPEVLDLLIQNEPIKELDLDLYDYADPQSLNKLITSGYKLTINGDPHYDVDDITRVFDTCIKLIRARDDKIAELSAELSAVSKFMLG